MYLGYAGNIIIMLMRLIEGLLGTYLGSSVLVSFSKCCFFALVVLRTISCDPSIKQPRRSRVKPRPASASFAFSDSPVRTLMSVIGPETIRLNAVEFGRESLSQAVVPFRLDAWSEYAGLGDTEIVKYSPVTLRPQMLVAGEYIPT